MGDWWLVPGGMGLSRSLQDEVGRKGKGVCGCGGGGSVYIARDLHLGDGKMGVNGVYGSCIALVLCGGFLLLFVGSICGI